MSMSRPLCIRLAYSRWPRAIASVGETLAASHAGDNAAITDMPIPISNAITSEVKVSSIAPGRLLTYSACTVAESSFNAPVAITRPGTQPSKAPITPKNAASPKNAPRTSFRLAPSARTIPISARRRTTETEMVL